MSSVVQSTYSENIPKGYPGQIADLTDYEVDTRICETAAGIGFGLACAQGSADKGATLGGAIGVFVGCSVRDPALKAGNSDKYAENDLMGVLRRGDVYVTAGAEVSPGDDVHYNSTTGAFSNTGGSGPIKGARWMTSTASGEVGVVRFTGQQGNT